MKLPHSRHEALEPMRQNHDHSLELCYRIRKGLQGEVEPRRIKEYTDWFQVIYLKPHFELEARCIFPVLGRNNVRVKKALANHRRLLRLFNRDYDLELALNLIEEELGTYIRFEESILYKEIQSVATPHQLSAIQKCHEQIKFEDQDWKDRFWNN